MREPIYFRNPRNGKATEITIYHNLRLISIYTTETITLAYMDRLNEELEKLKKKFKAKKTMGFNSYRLQLLGQ